jgi:hypothetical protein
MSKIMKLIRDSDNVTSAEKWEELPLKIWE